MEELFLKYLEPDEQIIDTFFSGIKKVISPLEYIFIPFFVYSVCFFINYIFKYKTIFKLPLFIPFYIVIILFIFWVMYFKYKIKKSKNNIYCLTNKRLCQLTKTFSGYEFSTISFSAKNPLIVHNLIERVQNGNESLLSASKYFIITAFLLLSITFTFLIQILE